MTSKKVYITPSVFAAFLDRAHPQHEQASAYFRFFAQDAYMLFCDTISLTQAYQIIYDDMSVPLAKDFLRTIYLSDLNILYPEEGDMKAALKTLVTYKSNDLTFPKALVAVLAYRRNIPQVCSFEVFPSLFGLSAFYLPM